MKVVKTILKWLLYLLIGLILSLCLYVLITTGILKQDYANIFGYTYFQVKTGSMAGTIEEGDIVIVKIGAPYKENDIITFKGEDAIITHRLISEKGDLLITRGDVNNIQDEPVKKDQVIGKVVLTISTSLVLKILGILLIMFVILTLINFDTVFKKFIVKDTKEKQDSKKKGRKKKEDVDKTIQIPLEEVLKLQELEEKEQEKVDQVEPSSQEQTFIEILDDFTKEISDYDLDSVKEQDFLNQVLKLLQIENHDIKKTRINATWSSKFCFVYRIANILYLDDQVELSKAISEVPFDELFDYEFEEIGLSKPLQDRLYDMPLYVFIKILIFSIIFDDEEFFDAVYKIFKFKVKVDKDHKFTSLSKKKKKEKLKEERQLEEAIHFMNLFSERFDQKNVMELNKIKEYVELKKQINQDAEDKG